MIDAAATPAWPGPRQRWLLVAVLFLALVVSFLDRQILALLVDPIRADLGLSDLALGLLQGLAFAILYALAGLPLGRLVDRLDRRRIAAIGILVWSLATIGCGLARSFEALFAARVLVGVGEAALAPAAYSLIADSFPPGKRALPLSVYSLGITFGGGLAFVIGGTLFAHFENWGGVMLPVVGILQPWQATFVAVGLPGFVIAGALLLVPEPERRGRMNPLGSGVSIGDAVRFVATRWRFYAPLLAASGLTAMTSYALIWLPAMFSRRFGWGAGDYGWYAGWILLSAGSLGMIAAGLIADRRNVAARPDGTMRTLMFFAGAGVVCAIATPLLSTPTAVLAAFAVCTFLLLAPSGLTATILQGVTPNELRGQVSAIYLLTLNLTGLGFGPTAVAWVSDRWIGDPTRIGEAIAIVCAIAGPLGIALLEVARRNQPTSVEPAAS